MSMFCTEFQTGRNSRLENDGQISGFRVFRCRCGETVLKDYCPANKLLKLFSLSRFCDVDVTAMAFV